MSWRKLLSFLEPFLMWIDVDFSTKQNDFKGLQVIAVLNFLCTLQHTEQRFPEKLFYVIGKYFKPFLVRVFNALFAAIILFKAALLFHWKAGSHSFKARRLMNFSNMKKSWKFQEHFMLELIVGLISLSTFNLPFFVQIWSKLYKEKQKTKF